MAEHTACEPYPECAGDVETILCTVQDGTHCGNYASFGIPDIAWEVLQRHTLPLSFDECVIESAESSHKCGAGIRQGDCS